MLKKILIKVGVLSILIGVTAISLPVQPVQAYPYASISISPYSPYAGERVTFIGALGLGNEIYKTSERKYFKSPI